MSVILVFLFMIISFAVWWLARQRILSKPWLEPGVAGPYAHGHYQCRFFSICGFVVSGGHRKTSSGLRGKPLRQSSVNHADEQ